MSETGCASDWLARYAQLDSDVCFKMNFHKNAIHGYTGISNALQRAIKEKEKMLQESNVSRTVWFQLKAAKDELIKKNEEQAAEIQSLKRELQASKACYTPGLQGSGCAHNKSGVKKRPVQKGKTQEEGQGLSTEHGGVEEETRNINAKPTKRTYRRNARAEGPKDSSAFKVRRSSRLAAMEKEAESVNMAAKFDVGEASHTLATALQDDAGYADASTATPAALHTLSQECGLSPDELQAVMLLSSMYRCSPTLP